MNEPQTDASLKTWAWVVHGLYVATFFTGITSIPGVIVAYLKRGDARGTRYESHFTYAIRTFWLGLAGTLLIAMLFLTIIGIPLCAVMIGLLSIWWIIRMVRPIVALLDNRPIADPYTYL